MKFNFKSVGVKVDNQKFKLTEPQKERFKTPLGIKTPLSFGDKNSNLFQMHDNPAELLKDNLRNLLQTNAGERLGRYNFGCNLSSFLFERISLNQEFEQLATQQIIEQVKKYMPILQVDDVKFKVEKKNLNSATSIAKIQVRVFYTIPRIQLSNQIIDVILYVGG